MSAEIAHLTLDSASLDQWLGRCEAVHRARAHRFYFREGFAITAYSFRKALSDNTP
ncbi:hypothetical protein [Acidiphilium sp. MT5]